MDLKKAFTAILLSPTILLVVRKLSVELSNEFARPGALFISIPQIGAGR